jgi:hypothetical protein
VVDHARDVRRSPTIDLADRELATVVNALRHRRADYTGMRNLCDRLNSLEERERWAREILEIDLVRVKLVDETKDEETGI